MINSLGGFFYIFSKKKIKEDQMRDIRFLPPSVIMIISSFNIESARNMKNVNYLINQESDLNNLKSLRSNKIP